MSLMQKFEHAAGAIDRLAERVGRLIAWFSLAMVSITFAVVVLRYGLGMGWIALQESVIYLHASLLMLGMAYTLKHDAHVRVDVFYARLDVCGQAWVNFLGAALLLVPVCGFVFWISLDYTRASWRVFEHSSQAGGLPGVFVLKTLIPITALALLAQGVALMVRAAANLRRNLD